MTLIKTAAVGKLQVMQWLPSQFGPLLIEPLSFQSFFVYVLLGLLCRWPAWPPASPDFRRSS
jgi:hypothetical protein